MIKSILYKIEVQSTILVLKDYKPLLLLLQRHQFQIKELIYIDILVYLEKKIRILRGNIIT